MKILKTILTILFGIILVLGGINHFITPEMYNPFIPDFLPSLIVNYLTGLVEIALGVGVFLHKFKRRATIGILVLMLAFLPLHIIDVFSSHPAVGSHQLALIRLPIQFLLIYWAWFINRR